MRLTDTALFHSLEENQRGMGLRASIPVDSMALFRGLTQPVEPIPFHYNHGSVPSDLIMCGAPWFLLMSGPFRQVLEAGGFTGWSTYPVAPSGRKGVPIEGYLGLAITGRAGLPQWQLAERSTKRYVERGPEVPMLRGLHFDMETWDGSDMFVLGDKGYIIVADAVAKALTAARMRNVRLTRLSEYEVSAHTVLGVKDRGRLG